MSAILAIVLFLMSASCSASQECEKLLRPSDQPDPHWEGRWILVAGSFQSKVHEDVLKGKDSVTIDVRGSTFVQADRLADQQCLYFPQNISSDGPSFGYSVGSFNITGAVVHTSCADCMAFRLDYQSPVFTTSDFYLLSKRRRELQQQELEEFKAQAECLQMHPAHMMDPTKELCPERADVATATPTQQ